MRLLDSSGRAIAPRCVRVAGLLAKASRQVNNSLVDATRFLPIGHRLYEKIRAHHRRWSGRLRSGVAVGAPGRGGAALRNAAAAHDRGPCDGKLSASWCAATRCAPIRCRRRRDCSKRKCASSIHWCCASPKPTACRRARRWRWTVTGSPSRLTAAVAALPQVEIIRQEVTDYPGRRRRYSRHRSADFGRACRAI